MAPPPIIRCLMPFSRSHSSSTCRLLNTCIGIMAEKTVGGMSFIGCPQGATGMRFSPATSERITTIFPAMYCRGMHSMALSPLHSPKNSTVIMAEFIILRFSTHSFFGVPVEPEVCTHRVGEGLNHSARKSARAAWKLSSPYCCRKASGKDVRHSSAV